MDWSMAVALSTWKLCELIPCAASRWCERRVKCGVDELHDGDSLRLLWRLEMAAGRDGASLCLFPRILSKRRRFSGISSSLNGFSGLNRAGTRSLMMMPSVLCGYPLRKPESEETSVE